MTPWHIKHKAKGHEAGAIHTQCDVPLSNFWAIISISVW